MFELNRLAEFVFSPSKQKYGKRWRPDLRSQGEVKSGTYIGNVGLCLSSDVRASWGAACCAPTKSKPDLEMRVLGVPGGVVLVVAGGLDCGGVVAGAGYELDAYGKVLVGEAAGDAEGWQATEIADAA